MQLTNLVNERLRDTLKSGINGCLCFLALRLRLRFWLTGLGRLLQDGPFLQRSFQTRVDFNQVVRLLYE